MSIQGRQGRARRQCRIRRVIVSAATLFLITFGVCAPRAEAVTFINRVGVIGPVYGWGGTVCNPFRSGGFASRYIEIGSPMVSESAPVYNPNVSVIGGSQAIRWQPFLEKYVGNRWVLVWTGQYSGPVSLQYVTTFSDPMVDVYRLAKYAGKGYFRTGGTVHWVDDSLRAPGLVRYRHTAGNYFKNGYAHQGGAKATKLTTPYCWAG